MQIPVRRRARPTGRRHLLAALVLASVAAPILSTAALAEDLIVTITDAGISVNGVFQGDVNELYLAPGQDQAVDADRDLLSDSIERAHGLDPYNADSDFDGLGDGVELYSAYGYTDPLAYDTDSDGLSDGAELLIYQTDPSLVDSDFDGFADGQEVTMGRNPLVALI